MYGRRTSDAFSISTTLRIYLKVSLYLSKDIWEAHLDRPEPGTVAGSHVLVKRLGSIDSGDLAKLLVHIMGA